MRLLTKENLSNFNLDKDLIAATSDRIETGHFKDAIIAAFTFLTDFIRAKSGETSGDGTQLVGKVLGGTAPILKINDLQTQSQIDEQKGIQQILVGLYMGIRNPRSHENITDDEEFCIRVLIIIDTILQFLKRDVAGFDITGLVNRVFDPFFVESQDYANLLIEQVPVDQSLKVFIEIFERREESKPEKIRLAMLALYHQLSPKDSETAVQKLGEELRVETDLAKISDLFKLLRYDLWVYLQSDVQLRMENMILEECRKGSFSATYSSGLQGGSLGIWATYFGKYFYDRNRLSEIICSLLNSSWNTQNYVGNYFMNVLPQIIDDSWIEKSAKAIAHATVINDAKILKIKLKEVCHRYPESWKKALAMEFQALTFGNKSYVLEILPLLEG